MLMLACLINIACTPSLVVQTGKNLPAVWETQALSLSWEHPLEKEMATHSSILAWRINSMDREAWWAIVHRVTKSQKRLSDLTFTNVPLSPRWEECL